MSDQKENTLLKEVSEVLDRHGWGMSVGQLPTGGYELRISPKHEKADPPPLGVHVVDGAGAVDRVG
jgi:hypothetical protein